MTEGIKSSRRRIIFGASLLAVMATTFAAETVWRSTRATETAQHDSDARAIGGTLEETFADYALVLRAGVGLFDASRSVERTEWHAFSFISHDTLNAIAFLYIERVARSNVATFLDDTRADDRPDFHIHGFPNAPLGPESPENDLCIVKFSDGPAAAADDMHGFNMASEPAAYEALWRAAESGEPTLSPPLDLVSRDGWGVLYSLPVYAKGASLATAPERRAATVGWVAIPITAREFVTQARQEWWGARALTLRATWHDGAMRTIYQDDDAQTASGIASGEIAVAAGDQTWILEVRRRRDEWAAAVANSSKIAAIVGTIAALLTLVVATLLRTQERAKKLAIGMTEELRRSEARYALAVRASHDGLWDWDLESNTAHYAPRWAALVGATAEELTGTPSDFLRRIASEHLVPFQEALARHIDGDTDRFDREVELTHSDGHHRWMLCRAIATRDDAGRAVRLTGSIADITALKHAHTALRDMALHDTLTGLPNRTLFMDRLRESIARRRRHPLSHFAVLFLDFDRFKLINDTLGHDVGDAMLGSIAERLRESLRETDVAARFGGDEFVVLLNDVMDEASATIVCERMVAAFDEPHHVGGREVTASVSIGLVGNPSPNADAHEIVRDADVAMYHAKLGGKARYCVFDAAMQAEAVERLSLECDLRNATFDRDFRIAYQPIVSLADRRITGFEALLRWTHPRLGTVMPDTFIPIAEETGLIVSLGTWVLRTACTQLVEWRKEVSSAPLTININLSKRQLLEPDFETSFTAILAETGAAPADVCLEITETSVMDERHDLIRTMERLRAQGVHLAMDDFGTGHSSLSCLHRFPLDTLKIDRSFVSELHDNRDFKAVLETIVTLARHLDLSVVAEGIETHEQLEQLLATDCLLGQGYLFSVPLAASAATEVLRSGLPAFKAAA